MKAQRKMNKQEMMLHLMLKESTCDTLCKMLIAHVLTMPKGDKFYYEKINVVVEFLEECIPAHPGAFSAYFKILDLMPATAKRKMPDEMLRFVEENLEEIEKFYADGEIGKKLPEKYRPSSILMPNKGLVAADGVTPIGMETPPSIILP
jgi:hypothetical protein